MYQVIQIWAPVLPLLLLHLVLLLLASVLVHLQSHKVHYITKQVSGKEKQHKIKSNLLSNLDSDEKGVYINIGAYINIQGKKAYKRQVLYQHIRNFFFCYDRIRKKTKEKIQIHCLMCPSISFRKQAGSSLKHIQKS